MCGITGYIGNKNAAKILLDGLKNLEYRGYDSAGVALSIDGRITLCKEKGRLCNLEEKVRGMSVCSNIGIGHTRWATHGCPSAVNSHPHLSNSGNIAVVHNGIIENYEVLKEELICDGVIFKSETDTEVIPHLIEKYFSKSLEDAVRKAVARLEGSFAICVISALDDGKIVAARQKSPLVIGLGEGEKFIASDMGAVVANVKDFYILDDGEIATIGKNMVSITDFSGKNVEKDVYKANFSEGDVQKGSFNHFMQKEIFEQPTAVEKTIQSSMTGGEICLPQVRSFLKSVGRLYIVACGTAYHAGLVGKRVIESVGGIPVEVDLASEFRYRNPLFAEDVGVILISQSGETADTLAALYKCREKGVPTLAVTNVLSSTLARECDAVFYTSAGPEIAVASTKAYTTQLAAMYLISICAAEKTGFSGKKLHDDVLRTLYAMPYIMTDALKLDEKIKELAKKLYTEKNIYFIGRGLDMFTMLEGALKMKEITYIHSDTYARGEIKHGPIALIDNGSVVITAITDAALAPKCISNVKEVVARGARTIGILTENCKEFEEVFDFSIVLPQCHHFLTPLLSVIPLQLLSYHVAVLKGCDVDKPKNLAKSVTVE